MPLDLNRNSTHEGCPWTQDIEDKSFLTNLRFEVKPLINFFTDNSASKLHREGDVEVVLKIPGAHILVGETDITQ